MGIKENVALLVHCFVSINADTKIFFDGSTQWLILRNSSERILKTKKKIKNKNDKKLKTKKKKQKQRIGVAFKPFRVILNQQSGGISELNAGIASNAFNANRRTQFLGVFIINVKTFSAAYIHSPPVGTTFSSIFMNQFS